jgi:hypothetical protein
VIKTRIAGCKNIIFVGTGLATAMLVETIPYTTGGKI